MLLPLPWLGVSPFLADVKLLPPYIEFLTVAWAVFTTRDLAIGEGFSPLTKLTLFVINRSGLFGGRVRGSVVKCSSYCVCYVCKVVAVTNVSVLCTAVFVVLAYPIFGDVLDMILSLIGKLKSGYYESAYCLAFNFFDISFQIKL